MSKFITWMQIVVFCIIDFLLAALGAMAMLWDATKYNYPGLGFLLCMIIAIADAILLIYRVNKGEI